jgi:hypothetical protein
MGGGAPQPISKVVSWDVPSGTIGDVIGYSIYCHDGGQAGIVQYNYTYRAQATPPIVASTPTVDNSPIVTSPVASTPTVASTFDVKLVVSPDSPTDVDAIDIEAVPSGDYKGSLSYVWSMNNVVMQGETGVQN